MVTIFIVGLLQLIIRIIHVLGFLIFSVAIVAFASILLSTIQADFLIGQVVLLGRLYELDGDDPKES